MVNLKTKFIGLELKSPIIAGSCGLTSEVSKIEEIALNNGHLTVFIEAPEQRPLAELITPKIAQILRKLSFNEDVKGKVHSALKAVKSFIGSVKLEYAGVAISVDPEPGVADSGDFEADFSELMVIIGETAKAAGKPITILIDEVQYLSEKDLAALIVALHKINQKNLLSAIFLILLCVGGSGSSSKYPIANESLFGSWARK